MVFAFTYDTRAHTICPFGQLATVFINASENPNTLLGYLEDAIVDMVLSQANANRQIREILGITRDEQTNGNRTQHIINLYTSSRRFGTPTPGFDRIEIYRACNPSGTAWHQERVRYSAEGRGLREPMSKEAREEAAWRAWE